MASKNISRTLRPLARQLATPAVQRRTFVAASSLVRATAVQAARPAAAQQVRGVKTIDFAGHKETVYGSLFLDFSATSQLILQRQSVRIGQGRSSW